MSQTTVVEAPSSALVKTFQAERFSDNAIFTICIIGAILFLSGCSFVAIFSRKGNSSQ